MNASKQLRKAFALAMMFGLAVALAAAWKASRVQAHDDDQGGGGQVINLWLSSASLVYGETLRTTLTNFNSRRVSVRPTFVNADGVVVKQAAEPLVLEPGQMRSFEVSRSEVGGGGGPTLTNSNPQSVMLRPAMTMRQAEARKMLVATEVVNEATGSAKLQTAGGDCPSFMCGGTSNHNETLVRDARR
jgi:hypothetical protein